MTPGLRSALAAELLKLRSVRSTPLVLVASELLVAAGVVGVAVDDGIAGQERLALSHVGVAAACSLVLGVIAVAGEHRHGTVSDTYLSFPRRTTPLLAKLVVTTGASLAIGLLAAVTGVVVLVACTRSAGVDATWGDAVWLTLAGGVACHVLFGALGVAVGAAVRNLAGAVALVLGWIALVEATITQLIGDNAARFLPFTSLTALARATTTAPALSQGAAAAVLTGYLIVIGAAASLVTLRRDVT
jgi:ABC-2 type transport system permease protein